MSNDTQPEIRFPGFTEDWEERKLGEVIDIENGYAFKSEYFSDEEKRHIVLTPGSVKIGGGFQKDKGRYYDVSGVFPEKFIFKPGNIFITMTDLTPTAQSLGYPAIVPRDDNVYLHNQRLGKIINTTTNPEFLYTLLTTDTYHKEIVSSASGTTVKHSSVSKILDFKSAIPNIDEQKLIGSFFKELDNTITLHQRKLDLLKETKKGFLQKMFPKNGAKVPEIRFPGFTEDWEQCKLGEIVRISSGFTGDSSLNIGQYELTRIETIATGQVNLNKVGYSNTEPDKKYLLDKGDILFSNINSLSHIGKIALFDLDMKLYHGINLLRLQPMNVNSQFLYQSFQLNNHLKWAKSHANQAVSQASINQTELSKQVFLVPSQQEQQKIGTFFKQLDDTITLYQRELDLLKKTKKGFLQKMFV